MAIFNINQTNTNIIEFNQTAPQSIVMIHGLLANMAIFYFKIAPKLAEKYHVVLYDIKGHGMSDTAKSGYDFQSLSNDLLEILNTLELKKVHLAGYSYGGIIALYTAMYHPERVDKLAIIDSPNPNNGNPRELLEKYSKDFLEQTIEKIAASTYLQTGRRQIDKIYKLHRYLFTETSIVEDTFQNKSFIQDIIHKNIPHETLLLYADKSDCKQDGELLRQYIHNSRLIYGEGDHTIPVQNPEWVSEKLGEFFSGTGKIGL